MGHGDYSFIVNTDGNEAAKHLILKVFDVVETVRIAFFYGEHAVNYAGGLVFELVFGVEFAFAVDEAPALALAELHGDVFHGAFEAVGGGAAAAAEQADERAQEAEFDVCA